MKLPSWITGESGGGALCFGMGIGVNIDRDVCDGVDSDVVDYVESGDDGNI